MKQTRMWYKIVLKTNVEQTKYHESSYLFFFYWGFNSKKNSQMFSYSYHPKNLFNNLLKISVNQFK